MGFVERSFQSLLPNGCKAMFENPAASPYNMKHCAALDCIFDEKQKIFYVLDIIFWEDFIYQEFPLCSRILFAQQKLANIPNLNDAS